MSKPLIVCEAIAVLHAERAEQRVGADAEEADADDLAVLLLGDDARLTHQLGLVLEDLVDDAAIDVELGRADSSGSSRDVGGHRARAARARRRRRRRRSRRGGRRPARPWPA